MLQGRNLDEGKNRFGHRISRIDTNGKFTKTAEGWENEDDRHIGTRMGRVVVASIIIAFALINTVSRSSNKKYETNQSEVSNRVDKVMVILTHPVHREEFVKPVSGGTSGGRSRPRFMMMMMPKRIGYCDG